MFDAPPKRSKRQWQAEAKIRVSKGECGSAVEADFTCRGLDVQTARDAVDEAVHAVRKGALNLLIGSVVAGIGVAVTIVSFFTALSTSDDGWFMLWCGPISCGGITGVVALCRLLTIRR